MILLLGANGQLGQELVAQARAIATPISAFSREQVDITDRAAIKKAAERKGIDLVVNAAAYTKVDEAEGKPNIAAKINCEGAGIVAAASELAGLPLIHISTDYVFDGNAERAYVETDPVRPVSVYGRSKAAGEEVVRRSNPKHIILRTSWLYGIYGHNFLKTIVRLAAEKDELQVVADQRGSPTSTSDLAEAIVTVSSMLHKGIWGTYHFAGKGETTWFEFASRIIDAQVRFTKRRPLVKPVETATLGLKAMRPKNSTLDSSRFIATFGLSPKRWDHNVDRVVSSLFSRSADGA